MQTTSTLLITNKDHWAVLLRLFLRSTLDSFTLAFSQALLLLSFLLSPKCSCFFYSCFLQSTPAFFTLAFSEALLLFSLLLSPKRSCFFYSCFLRSNPASFTPAFSEALLLLSKPYLKSNCRQINSVYWSLQCIRSGIQKVWPKHFANICRF